MGANGVMGIKWTHDDALSWQPCFSAFVLPGVILSRARCRFGKPKVELAHEFTWLSIFTLPRLPASDVLAQILENPQSPTHAAAQKLSRVSR